MITLYCTDREMNDGSALEALCGDLRATGASPAATAPHEWPERANLIDIEECENNDCTGCAWCDAIAEFKSDVERFDATGELPAPLPDAEFDRRVDEMNREREAIESGSVEPPAGGWLVATKRRRCTCADGNVAECARHGL